ncbi:uncharacterized protein EDB91DRAFT_1079678 [Suillus paluster]|uniref:uncharacterized protein n=1 Tax=Suillus paluster TaxID=48578 RepID=UPI001B870E79|nr:uncharacterized protein EDB91DRAFT_1079678 [Suillus paluster]KAG1747039.1 hypothetical protein EDB91DRAFT_1079678 [Suillus paluster]
MNNIKLELPAQIQAFSFTFETSTPGPVTVEIAIQKSLKRSSSDTETQRPEIVNHWGEAQKVANFRHVGGHIMPGARADEGPISHGFAVPLHEPLPPLSLDVEFHDPPHISDSTVEQEMLDFGFLTGKDLDIMTHGRALPNLRPNFHSLEALLTAVDHFDGYNTATAAGGQPLTAHEAHCLPINPKWCGSSGRDDLDVNIDVDAIFDDQDDDEDHSITTLNTGPDEDEPNPFIVEEVLDLKDNRDLTDIPPHLLTIYMVVSWLHLQFHLPRVACNALLTIFACILILLLPAIKTSFITLQSSNRVLGVDKSAYTLPVCPICRDVYSPGGSPQSHDMCITCNVSLFLPDLMKHGNLRAIRSPVVKYHYLLLSEQLKSLLKVLDLEANLNAWQSKPRNPGEYTDIFNGDMYHTKLQGVDGKIFFLNLPHEKNGPDGELQIGVNLGVDCPKEQNPDQIQRFLHPIVSDLLRLWKSGVQLPMESCPQGRLVCVILVAVVCNKPAAHKIGGFVSHSHTHFSFQPRTNTEQQDLVDPMHNLFLGLVKTHFIISGCS